eukprot:m.141320 g.141320  ORF g.141320 m.141320 type:complete len:81 (+) comp38340_c0_seq1:184-426(+)
MGVVQTSLSFIKHSFYHGRKKSLQMFSYLNPQHPTAAWPSITPLRVQRCIQACKLKSFPKSFQETWKFATRFATLERKVA